MRVTSSDLCAQCGSDGRVFDTRPGAVANPTQSNGKRGTEVRAGIGPYRRRRYRCMKCDNRWTTYEFTAEDVFAFIDASEASAAA